MGSERLTDDELAELERLERRGPFAFEHWARGGDNEIAQGDYRIVARVPKKMECEDAARWLCAAANALPRLLAEVRAIRNQQHQEDK